MGDETAIYVIGAPRGPKKIGLAKNPLSRMKAIQTGHGRAITLLHVRVVPRALSVAIERRAHWLLRASKTHGEWFDVSVSVARKAVDEAVASNGDGEKERPPVGRPPLNPKDVTVKTTLRLTQGVLDRIEALVGPNRTATFIRDAVEGELRRRERKAQGKSSEGAE